MLELTKKILKTVSFDAQLFHKELMKGLKWITSSDEIIQLKEWCFNEFGKMHPTIIKTVFATKK